jgi:hypothetical protein
MPGHLAGAARACDFESIDGGIPFFGYIRPLYIEKGPK